MLFGPGTYLVPREDGLLVVGATSEPEAGFSEGLTPEGQKQLQAGIAALLPEASQWPPMERWWGFRPCTPDEGPLLGASPMAGLWLACGHHRNGVLLAAITAELLAGAITQETPSSADAALLGALLGTGSTEGISPQRANPDQKEPNHSVRKAGTTDQFRTERFQQRRSHGSRCGRC